jgi:hypothetical protein
MNTEISTENPICRSWKAAGTTWLSGEPEVLCATIQITRTAWF